MAEWRGGEEEQMEKGFDKSATGVAKDEDLELRQDE